MSLAVMVSLLFTVATLFQFYDHYWYPPDDGAYAYVADQILSGAVLNLDIHDIHMGYINFINAFSLKIFGNEMVSLRIPLFIMGIIQSLILFKIFQEKGVAVAVMSSVVITAFSFIQFLNPTANWYGLFITIILIFSLDRLSARHKYRLFIVGFLLITLFMFRQLTGIITAMGVVTFLLFQGQEKLNFKDGILSKIIFGIMLLGLSGYLVYTGSPSAFLMFGIGPLALLMVGLCHVSMGNQKTFKMVLHLVAGGILAAAPLLMYHIYHGSLFSWYNDVVLSALLLTKLNFIQAPSYFSYIIYSLYSMGAAPSLQASLNGLLWVSLTLAATFTSFFTLRKLLTTNKKYNNMHPLPMVCVFYALVSIHFQIPIYLFFSAGLSLCAILWLLYEGSPLRKNILLFSMAILSITAIYYQAGQPSHRSIKDILGGNRIETEKAFLGGKVNLWIEQDDADLYEHINDLVQIHVDRTETILAFPSNAEIYYITQRSNPLTFFNLAFGILNQEQFDKVMLTMTETPPRMVFYSPDDKYNTAFTKDLAKYVRNNYRLLDTKGKIEIYLRPSAP